MKTTEVKTMAWRLGHLPDAIEQALTEAVDENGEIVNETALERVEALTAQKVITAEQLGMFIKEAREYDKALKARKDEIQVKRDRLASAIEICLSTLGKVVSDGERIETPDLTIAWKNNPPKVEVDCDPDMLPDEYRRTKITVEADKKAIGEALKAGQVIEGARLVQDRVISVK